MDNTQHIVVLHKDSRYQIKTLRFVGWTTGDGSSTDGYNCWDYFSADGTYRGADIHGIEPTFEVVHAR